MATSSTPHRGLHSSHERIHLAWDLLMVALVTINLALLLFDSLFLIPPLNAGFEAIAPGLYTAYDQTIHDNFFSIDLFFVTIFLLDVLIGWAVAIAEQRYHRWFFYPFVHWYDVLGCIPLAGLRWLRVLRVFSLIYRLQRLGLVDVRRWSLFEGAVKYYDILLEEVSDRVAIRLVGSVQEEIRDSDAFTRRISQEVLAPRKQQLVAEIAQRLEDAVGSICEENRALIARYVSSLVGRTMQENRELQRLRSLPFGNQMANAMDNTITDVAHRLVNEAIVSLRSPEFKQLLEQFADVGVDTLLITDTRTDRITEQVLIDTLEILKEQIAVKQWRDRYD